ncbi:MAG: flagellar hook-length control protein FliK [Novosphingobium sp.]
MNIDSTLIASTTTELRGQPLKTGQKLAAIVLRANQGTGKALLSVAGGQLVVHSRQTLTPGSAIELTVTKLGPPVVLSLNNHVGEPVAAKPATAPPIQTLISLLMTRLGALTPAGSPSGPHTFATASLRAESTLGKPTVGGTATANQPTKLDLPLDLRAALPRLDLLLNGERTSPSSISALPVQPAAKQTLARQLAQLILANSLPVLPANAPIDPAAINIRSQLKRAAQQLKLQASLDAMGASTSRSAPTASTRTSTQNTSLQSSLDQWIGRLDISQLRTAITQIQGQASWVVDAPVMLAGQPRRFQIAIHEQPEHTNPPAESTWQIDFAIDLPELGPLHGSLSLQSTDLTVRMYADNPLARVQLDASLDQLAEHLRAASLTPRELSVYPGPPPQSVQERLNPAPILEQNSTFRYQV